MTSKQKIYLENLKSSAGKLTISQYRASLQIQFGVSRMEARKIVFEWLKYYPFKQD